MRTSRILLLASTIGAMTVSSAAVFGQTPPASSSAVSDPERKDPATRVNSLNEEAKALMGAGDFANACPKLEEAVRLAPETAIGARLNLAECYAKTGRAVIAYNQYSAAAALAEKAGQGERVKLAGEGTRTLQASVAVLTLEVAEELFSLPGLTLALDGVVMPELRWVRVLGLDWGAHKIEVSAPGYTTSSVRIEGLKLGEARTVSIPMPERESAAPKGLASSAPSPGPAASAGQPAPAPEAGNKLPGLIGLGVGGAALVAGGALVGLALAEESALISEAPKDGAGNLKCTRTARPGEDALCADLRSRAETGSLMGNVGIGLLAGGGVLAVASVVYLLVVPAGPASSKKSSRVVPVVGERGGGLVWTGSF